MVEDSKLRPYIEGYKRYLLKYLNALITYYKAMIEGIYMEPEGLSEQEKTLWQQFLTYSATTVSPDKVKYFKDQLPLLEEALEAVIPKIEAVSTLEELSALSDDIEKAFSFAMHRQATER